MTVSASAVACTDGTVCSAQGLCGSRTGTQAVASFPVNSSETKYVIVTSTVNAQSGGNKGTLYMSIVDFATHADGRIVRLNQPVWPGTACHTSTVCRPIGKLTILATHMPTTLRME